MALGPKAMGEAIAANLKPKTGKTLEEWLSLLDTQTLTDKKDAITWLKSQGLGHFQAQLVADKYSGEPLYDNPEQIVDELFAGYPDQKELYDAIMSELQSHYKLVVNPCKGYIPLYSQKNTIFASMKPTKKGLYIGLIGDDFPHPTVQHTLSLGGSERMQKGMYAHDKTTALEMIGRSYSNNQ